MKLIDNKILDQAAKANADNGDPFDQEIEAKISAFRKGAEYAEVNILSEVYNMLTWASKNDYEPIHDGRWVKRFMSFTISSEELFNKWLKEKNNEN